MSYTSGIGGAAQYPVTVETAGAGKVGKADQSSLPAGVQGGVSASSVSANLGSDNATLSAAANLVGQALTGSDVRTEKVAALQQAIAAGTYNVSSSDVADKLISSLLK
jgi:negative regulator of flagellin synthesis FlgM